MTRCYRALISCGLSPCWLLLVFLCLCANSAYATTVTKTPTLSTDCTSVAGIGTKSWSRASRAISSNNSYATASVDGTTTKYLKCLNYGFSIPTTATINGITVSVERKSNSASNGGSHDAAMRVVKGGVIGTTDKSTTTVYTTSDVTEAHGSASEFWGLGWTAADINATNFGAAFAATKPSSTGTAHRISVDLMSITVDYTLDTTPPTVSSITLANDNPVGASAVTWTVVFSESVTGVDAADFSLIQAAGVSGASITSVTGSGTTWTVTAATGSGSGTLGLNLADNDTVIDLSSNKLGGTGANNGSFTGAVYTVDKVNPTVASIDLAASDPTIASSVSWTVVFSESVAGVDAADFSLIQAAGVSGSSITSVTGSGATYTVTANAGSGSGTLGLNVADNDTIIDATSHTLGGAGAGNGNFTGQVYTIDRTAPSVISINRADADPSSADAVTWTVIFSESVAGVNTGDFTLAASGLTGAYVASASGSGATWTVVANTGICAGTCTLGLNLADDDSIVDLAGNKLGGTGTGNGNFTGQVYSISSTGPFAGYSMDEASWNGTDDEVVDSYGGSDGAAYNSATTAIGDTGNCRYGVFDNGGTITKGGVLLPAFPDLVDDFTITAWVRTTDNTKIGQRIFMDDESKTNGYGLSLGDAGAGTLRFYSRGGSVVTLDTSNVIANNTWYFVAGVVDVANGKRYLYVFNASGTLLSSVSVASTWGGGDIGDATYNGDASIGAETLASAESAASYHVRGNLDELFVYGKVLNQAALTTLAQSTHACAASFPHHIEISHPTGTGVTCAPSTLTLRVCADAACSSLYTGGISGTLTAATTGTANWDGGSANFTIPPSGSVTKTLQLTSANTTVSATLGTISSAANATTCTFSGCIFTAANSGFIFDIPDHVAATTQNLTIRAVQKATNSNSCVSGFSGLTPSRSVQMTCAYQSPASGTLPVRVNGIALNPANNASSACVSANAVNLTFDGAGAATATVDYADVGQVNLTVAYAGSAATGDAGLSINGTDSFIAAPKDFAFSGVTSGLIKAGSDFSATVTARNNSGGTTPNFGKEAAPESVALSFVKYQPTGAGTVSGTFSGTVGPFSNGAATGSNLNWSEVGTIDLSATLASGSYLGSGLTATGSTGSTGAVGRFIPDHFALTPGTVMPACSSSFTYFGQDGFSTAFTLTAKNVGNITTQNYQGTFARLGLATWSAFNFSSAGLPAGSLLSASASLPAAAWSQGVADVTATHQVNRPTTRTGETSVVVMAAPIDLDGVTMAATAVAAATPLRYGNLKLSNTYGSELLSLPVAIEAQYWNGSYYTVNTADSCTVFPASSISMGSYLQNLSACETHFSPAGSLALSGGVISSGLNLTAPGSGNTGSVDLTMNLGSSASGNTCALATEAPATAANLPWFGINPTSRATFGIYKGNSKFIYIRELY